MESFSVIMPVYKTRENAELILTDLKKENPGRLDQVIAITDCGELNFEWSKVKEIKNTERVGKANAINQALEESETSVNVLISSDICINPETIIEMAEAIFNGKELAVPRIKPFDSASEASCIAEQIWNLHHQVSKKEVKAGEAVAFRDMQKIPRKTVADEEFISSSKKGKKYLEDHIVLNQPPISLKQIYKQRRRIFIGHLELAKTTGYITPTTKLRLLLDSIKTELIKRKNPSLLLKTILIEVMARSDAVLRAVLGVEHWKWETIRTHKQQRD